MNAPVLATDAHGNRYAAVHVEELDEWAWLLARVEDWLLHARDETGDDWAEFFDPDGPRLGDVAEEFGQWTLRMRALAQGRPPTPPPGPLRHEDATMTCPVCHEPFAVSGRRRYCSDACRSTAWRRRHHNAPVPVVLPASVSRRALSIYECPDCDERFHAEQRCDDCGIFARRAGLGGCCPHCDEPVTVAELVGDGVVVDTGTRQR